MEGTENKKKRKGRKAKEPAERRGGGKLLVVFLVLIILAGLFVALIDFFTDLLWFKELGYVSVFLKQLFTQLKIGVPTFIIVTLVTYIYLKALKRNYFKKISSTEKDKSKSINVYSWLLSLVFGGGVTYFAVTQLWFEALQTIHGQDFGIKDPIFNIDASFYAFRLDFISHLNLLVIGALLGLLAVTVIYYMILLSLRTPQVFDRTQEPVEEEPVGDPFAEDDEDDLFSEKKTTSSKPGPENIKDMFGKFAEDVARGSGGIGGNRPKKAKSRQAGSDNLHELLGIATKQLTVVGIVFFLMVGIYYFLQQFSLLYTHTGAVYGAGFTDINITLWMYRVLMVLAVLGIIGVIMGAAKKSLKPIILIPVIMILVGVAGNGIGLLVQNFVVSPDEINKESKYLERNIEFTQYAYGLDNVSVKSFSASTGLTAADIANNDETISNIRINDYKPAQTFYNQTQSIRQYYTFNDVDVDRYWVNGEYTQTFLSGREIDETLISNTWINQHLKYTHGYGVTLSRVDKITSSGQPDMLVKNIPPESSVEEIKIDRPEIYFGELTDMYVIVNTDEDEFDYPDGDNNKYSRYEGNAGIKMNLINRIMFSIREHSMKLLVSSNINGDSRIIINRNIMTRVKTIFPYLAYEDDPYLAVVDGRLYWILDAYTTSSKFPYSEPYAAESTTNYIRNSVKVVIDAYNGDVSYYVVDNTDAIALTYAEIYPKLFKTMDQMPEEMKAHLRYPGTMFEIQANVYRRYHMNDVKVFYQNEDLWDISNEIYGTEEQPTESSYYILSLPGEKKAEFVNSMTFTPRDKKNMTGILMARNDGEHYGEIILYQLPKSKVVYGPMQIEAQIDQNTEISKEFSLWNSAGSKYSRGNLFVIPIEDSILYVEPVYLEATNSSIPEVKRVIVAYNDQIAYEPTLSAALESLFGTDDGSSSKKDDSDKDDNKDADSMTREELIQKAQEEYDAALEAQKAGDWAKYGEHLDNLGEYLEKLK